MIQCDTDHLFRKWQIHSENPEKQKLRTAIALRDYQSKKMPLGSGVGEVFLDGPSELHAYLSSRLVITSCPLVV